MLTLSILGITVLCIILIALIGALPKGEIMLPDEQDFKDNGTKEEKSSPSGRKPIQIIIDTHGNLIALCNDGTMWLWWLSNSGQWTQFPPIP